MFLDVKKMMKLLLTPFLHKLNSRLPPLPLRSLIKISHSNLFTVCLLFEFTETCNPLIILFSFIYQPLLVPTFFFIQLIILHTLISSLTCHIVLLLYPWDKITASDQSTVPLQASGQLDTARENHSNRATNDTLSDIAVQSYLGPQGCLRVYSSYLILSLRTDYSNIFIFFRRPTLLINCHKQRMRLPK